MLFTSAVFAFLFLPVVFAGFFIIALRSHRGAAAWLFAASLFFYGYWMPQFTVLLVVSICVNFYIGTRISQTLHGRVNETTKRQSRGWLIAGLIFNLGLLGYFKYANFFVDTINSTTGIGLDIGKVVLPIGISFFTFTQIAFLADAYQKGVREYKFIHYGLFVTYFPHLVAGPVLHHAQMMPQFEQRGTYRMNAANIAAGLSIFAIGLVKKVVLADGVSPYADSVFDAADGGAVPTRAEGWIGALAYTLQLYFDFSGYSDMAIGLSLLFNVRLPFNFDSPYKAASISDFWRRWHMSLSAFLRDYLYIPLGGNQKGAVRRYVNLMVTMVLGGLWHGASWTFVFWGGLHGLYLVVNHGFRSLALARLPALTDSLFYRIAGWCTTMGAVIIAWVFFRAQTFSGAGRILEAMFTSSHRIPEIDRLFWNSGLQLEMGIAVCVVLGIIACLAPNSNRIGEAALQIYRRNDHVCFGMMGVSFCIAVFLVIINATRLSASPFIYFNF
jgi:alginate O-acetyltransferase complex protein AlgI